MSLKIFHLCFITLSTLLAIGCAAWGFQDPANSVFPWVCVALAVAMVIYGVWFLKKTKKLIV
jgi:hypothetical protein